MTKELRWQVWSYSNQTCSYCSKGLTSKDFQVDHIRPVCKGGTDEITNLTIACATCNKRKGRKELSQIDMLRLDELDVLK